MIKKLIFYFFGLTLLLAACQGRGETGETPPARATQAVMTEPFAASPTPASQVSASPATTGEASLVKAANCTVVSSIPTPGPTEQSLFPPAGAGDWVKGPDSADVTIIEYSDFM